MAGPQPDYCGKCGAKVKPHHIYCIRCGQRIGDFIPPPRVRRRPVPRIAALIGVCAVVGIGLGALLAWALVAGQISSLGFLGPATVLPTTAVDTTPTSVVELTRTPMPFPSRTHTPTAIHTNTPVPSPSPTATATHSPTPTQTQPPRPSPTQVCNLTAGPTFRPLWVGVVQSHIGCPTSYEHGVITAYQEFDAGFMVWRSDRETIVYVFYNDGTYGEFTPTWEEGMPEYSCPDPSTPSTSPPTPRRGFGSVWCNYPVVRRRLGWARIDEIGDYRNLQDFQRGWMIQRAPRAGEPRYVAYSDTHTWKQY